MFLTEKEAKEITDKILSFVKADDAAEFPSAAKKLRICDLPATLF